MQKNYEIVVFLEKLLFTLEGKGAIDHEQLKELMNDLRNNLQKE